MFMPVVLFFFLSHFCVFFCCLTRTAFVVFDVRRGARERPDLSREYLVWDGLSDEKKALMIAVAV